MSAIAEPQLSILDPSDVNLKIAEVHPIEEVPCFGGDPPRMGSLSPREGYDGMLVVLAGDIPRSGELFLNVAGFSAMYRNPLSGDLDMSYPDALCIGQNSESGVFVLANFENVERRQRVQYYRNRVAAGPLYVRLVFFLPAGVKDFHVTFPAFVEKQ